MPTGVHHSPISFSLLSPTLRIFPQRNSALNRFASYFSQKKAEILLRLNAANKAQCECDDYAFRGSSDLLRQQFARIERAPSRTGAVESEELRVVALHFNYALHVYRATALGSRCTNTK